jgi:hypothetical protein
MKKTPVIQVVGIIIEIRRKTEPSTDDIDNKTSTRMNK